MRERSNPRTIQDLIEGIGRHAKGPGRIYFTGGATAVLLGWRETTLDVDLKLEPEPEGIFEALSILKEELGINIELAAPDQFVPPVPGWEARSLYIATHREVEFRHYDFYGQALAKIERGHTQDIADVQAMFLRSFLEPERLRRYFREIEPELKRYPSIDAQAFASKLDEVLLACSR